MYAQPHLHYPEDLEGGPSGGAALGKGGGDRGAVFYGICGASGLWRGSGCGSVRAEMVTRWCYRSVYALSLVCMQCILVLLRYQHLGHGLVVGQILANNALMHIVKSTCLGHKAIMLLLALEDAGTEVVLEDAHTEMRVCAMVVFVDGGSK